MNRDIQTVSNTLVYNNALRCGNQAVAQSMLSLPTPQRLPAPRGSSQDWLREVLNPRCRLVVMDTDGISDSGEACESRGAATRGLLKSGQGRGRGLRNEVEARLLALLSTGIVACGGIAAQGVGIIAPFRAQVQCVRDELRRSGALHDVEVETVDRYQGRDKPCILVSLVRSNDRGEVRRVLLLSASAKYSVCASSA